MLSTVLVAPTSRSASSRIFRPTIVIDTEETQVLVEQTTAVSPERLGEFVGRVSYEELNRINDSAQAGPRAGLTRECATRRGGPRRGGPPTPLPGHSHGPRRSPSTPSRPDWPSAEPHEPMQIERGVEVSELGQSRVSTFGAVHTLTGRDGRDLRLGVRPAVRRRLSGCLSAARRPRRRRGRSPGGPGPRPSALASRHQVLVRCLRRSRRSQLRDRQPAPSPTLVHRPVCGWITGVFRGSDHRAPGAAKGSGCATPSPSAR